MRLPFDEYEIRARIYPALIASLPLVALFYAAAPGAKSGLGVGAGTLLECAVLYFLARIARDRGSRVQPCLYERWDGKPTTRLLRHRDATIDPITKARYKSSLSRMTGVDFPSAATELQNPVEADDAYESCVRALLEQRRDLRKYRLIFSENCNYGFARNLLGIRSLGISLSLISLATGGAMFLFFGSSIPILVSFTVSAAILCFLLVYVNEGMVKRSGEAYATALLRSCEPGTPKATARYRDKTAGS